MDYFVIFACFGFTIFDLLHFGSAKSCRSTEWTCDDGSCIHDTLKCNGAVDCADGSDETFLLCMHNYCSGYRCVYGGCAPEESHCNGVKDCRDNSDEFGCYEWERGTPEELERELNADRITSNKLVKERLERYEESCRNGQQIGFIRKCDGQVDCEDGSDETLETCAPQNCWQHGVRFICENGACIDQGKVCDGVKHCADGSDELEELCRPKDDEREWYCEDGTRIDPKNKCDGVSDCPDSSDEAFVLCWNSKIDCGADGWRCVYGGCVPQNATCNGVRDCADNSDEMLLECRNRTTLAQCIDELNSRTDRNNISPLYDDCEIRALCAIDEQPFEGTLHDCAPDINGCLANGWFRCRDGGGCAYRTDVCDGIKNCADGSDELDAICDELNGKCVLPPPPKNGNYTVPERPEALPGQPFPSILAVFTCSIGYKLIGTQFPYSYCTKGHWSNDPAKIKCVSQCPLQKDPSIVYMCLPRGPLLSLEQAQECTALVPEGATVRPECRDAHYHYAGEADNSSLTLYHHGALKWMRCEEGGNWNYLPTCSVNCGLVTSKGDELVINGSTAQRGEFPWHAAIYKKTGYPEMPYDQICGGSLISNNVVISAAHCFWSDLVKQLPAENYAVAFGKLYRHWSSPRDNDVQKSLVSKIRIPPRFRGAAANFQDDIALMFLTTPVEYRGHVRPVCLNFDLAFEKTQLVTGIMGKVAGWGLTEEDGKASRTLQVAELPYVDVERCLNESTLAFQGYVTSDKICAGYTTSSALCRGDSGGGLVFAEGARYFLRGVVSTRPQNEHACNAHSHTAFTLVSKHQPFIQEHWK